MATLLNLPALDPAQVPAATGSTYPDDDIAGRATPQGRRFTRKDGTPY